MTMVAVGISGPGSTEAAKTKAKVEDDVSRPRFGGPCVNRVMLAFAAFAFVVYAVFVFLYFIVFREL